MREAGWTVKPYFPAGVFRYDGKKSCEDDASAFYLKPAEPPFRYGVYIYRQHPEKLSEKRQRALIDETCDRIRAMIGEEKELALVGGYAIGTDKENLKSLEDVAGELVDVYESIYGEIASFPPSFGYGMSEPPASEITLPYKEFVPEGVTNAFEISLTNRRELEEKPWWTEFMTYAYIVLPAEEYSPEFGEVIEWYISNMKLVPEPLRDSEDNTVSAMGIGVGECEKGIFLDNVVFNEKKFFRSLRILAPVLAAYDARVVLINADGVRRYRCGYEFMPDEEE